MRIIFVRHGHPDYTNDCLTELGQLQAEAVAQRLRDEKPCRIFSSSCGRAVQTAEHIARVHNKKVEQLDFMREIGGGPIDDKPIAHNGQAWRVSEEMVVNGQDVLNKDWEETEPFCRNKVIFAVRQIRRDFDNWLSGFGYEREGNYYRVRQNNNDDIVLTSHGGSSSAVMSHIFNLPFPFVCTAIRPDFTAITIVKFWGENGCLIAPEFEIANDARHIAGIVEQ